MKTTYLQFCKLGLAALTGLVTVSACKKDKNDQPAAPNYLLTAIHQDGEPIDSFTYNSNQQLDRLYSYYTTAGYEEYRQFEYDANGRCVRVKHIDARDGDLLGKDTLVYNNRDFTVYTEDDDEPFEIENGLSFKVGNDGITLVGSKDTITMSTGRRRVDYIEIIYSGGNLSSFKAVEYSFSPTTNSVNSNTATYSFTYDNRRSGLQWIAKHNPYASHLLNTAVVDSPIFPGGRNNIAGIKYIWGTETFTDVEEYTVTNTYDAASGYVATQAISAGGSEQVVIGFRYQKAE
ncbi:hypothetical protein MKQ68_07575 [Chitinophaga horti]|uniref:YD repeat-containing protein n=1 Tax=Chitinophaga horti TaxID=2920382 RepID=A0ABY6J9D9_9BACT|nr:hypothetical protein [Chitinophaga horti]UYQ94952.1 hypothetical protein MKQ68_07575 [Chitinophaga horti]